MGYVVDYSIFDLVLWRKRLNFLLYLDIMFISADSCLRRQGVYAGVPDVYLFERKSR